MRCPGVLSKLTVGDTSLGVKRIDVRFHLRIGGVMFWTGRPSCFGASINRHFLVLLRRTARDAIGADHFVPFEYRSRTAAGCNPAVGHGGKAYQQLRVSFLEPLLNDEPVGKSGAHRAESGHSKSL